MACVINTMGNPCHHRWDQKCPVAGVRQRSATENMINKFRVVIKETTRSRLVVKGMTSSEQNES